MSLSIGYDPLYNTQNHEVDMNTIFFGVLKNYFNHSNLFAPTNYAEQSIGLPNTEEQGRYLSLVDLIVAGREWSRLGMIGGLCTGFIFKKASIVTRFAPILFSTCLYGSTKYASETLEVNAQDMLRNLRQKKMKIPDNGNLAILSGYVSAHVKDEGLADRINNVFGELFHASIKDVSTSYMPFKNPYLNSDLEKSLLVSITLDSPQVKLMKEGEAFEDSTLYIPEKLKIAITSDGSISLINSEVLSKENAETSLSTPRINSVIFRNTDYWNQITVGYYGIILSGTNAYGFLDEYRGYNAAECIISLKNIS